MKSFHKAIEKIFKNQQIEEVWFWICRDSKLVTAFLNDADVFINKIRVNELDSIDVEIIDNYIFAVQSVDITLVNDKVMRIISDALNEVKKERVRLFKERPFVKEANLLNNLFSKWNEKDVVTRNKMYKYFANMLPMPDHRQDIFLKFKRDEDKIVLTCEQQGG